MIPYGRQEITQADIDAVIAVLQSDFLTQGPTVPQFEQAIADYCGVRHAVAMNSATSALHVAFWRWGLGRVMCCGPAQLALLLRLTVLCIVGRRLILWILTRLLITCRCLLWQKSWRRQKNWGGCQKLLYRCIYAVNRVIWLRFTNWRSNMVLR